MSEGGKELLPFLSVMVFKRVLITGASSGVGEAAAYAFSEQGCELFLVARREDRLAQVAEACHQKGSPSVVCRLHDLSVPNEGVLIVRECLQVLGSIEVLVCNAGYGILGPVTETSPQQLARLWQVNFQSGYESIHEALPHLLKQGRGHVVLVSSVIGKRSLPYTVGYCVTKFAQIALGEGLWAELKGSGIGVSVICPGRTVTEFQENIQLTQSFRSRRRHPAGQSPQVVARAIVNAVRHNRREVHLTPGGKLLCGLNRLSPTLTSLLIAWATRRLRRGG